MTGSRQVGALLIVLGLLYALLYVWWLRRSSRGPSEAGMSSEIDATEPAAELVAVPQGAGVVRPPRAPTPAWVVDISMDATVQDFAPWAETGPLMGASIQDLPVEAEAAEQTGASIQDSPVWSEAAEQTGSSIQDSAVEAEAAEQTGASIQDSPVWSEAAEQTGASIQDSPAETGIAPQSQGEAAMPQDGNP